MPVLLYIGASYTGPKGKFPLRLWSAGGAEGRKERGGGGERSEGEGEERERSEGEGEEGKRKVKVRGRRERREEV